MASVHDGLHTADEEVDATTFEDPFAASLAAKLGGEQPPEEAPASDEAPSGPARDPETGRFVPAQDTSGEDEGTPSAEDSVWEGSDWENRLKEKDAFIGRQSNEIGELRKRLEELEAKTQAEPEGEPEEYREPFISEQMAEAIVENAGSQGAVMAAIQDGLDPDGAAFKAIFDTAIENADSNAVVAELVDMRVQYRQAIAEYESDDSPSDAPPAEEWEKWSREQYQKQQMEQAVAQIRDATPDFADLGPFFPKALEVAPNLASEVQSGDPERVRAALSTLVHVARGVAAATGAATAGAQQGAASLGEQMRSAAQVATGSLRPVSPVGAPPTPDPVADVAAFKKAFRETLTPSVQDGLTND